MSADFILFKLGLREQDDYDHAYAQRDGRLGHHVDYDDDWLLHSPHLGWRVNQVRSALRWADSALIRKLAESLAGLEVRTVAQALAGACADIALVWGGSVLLGAGAALGSLAAGMGAVPGAALGAALGPDWARNSAVPSWACWAWPRWCRILATGCRRRCATTNGA